MNKPWVRLSVVVPALVVTLLSVPASAAPSKKSKADATASAAAGEWARYRGPNNDGISPETGWLAQWPAEGPKVLWKASLGTGYASISVAGGRAYTAGNQGDQDQIWCLDAEKGTVIWKYQYPCPLNARNFAGGPCATPTVDEGRVYTVSREGHLLCLDADKGAVVWQKHLAKDFGATPPKWGYSGSAYAHGKLLYVDVGASGASAVAFDKATGAVAWKLPGDIPGYATPLPFKAGAAEVVAFFNGGGLLLVNAANGQQVWKHPWKTSYDVNAAAPIVVGDQVFISSGYGVGCALLKIGQGVLWQNKEMKNHFNSSVLVGDGIYGFDDSTLKCLDLKTGAVRWAQQGLGKGSLMASDGKLIVLSEKGELVVAEANPAAFKAISRAQVLSGQCWTVPVLANGRIYARNAAGDLVCLDVKGK